MQTFTLKKCPKPTKSGIHIGSYAKAVKSVDGSNWRLTDQKLSNIYIKIQAVQAKVCIFASIPTAGTHTFVHNLN